MGIMEWENQGVVTTSGSEQLLGPGPKPLFTPMSPLDRRLSPSCLFIHSILEGALSAQDPAHYTHTERAPPHLMSAALQAHLGAERRTSCAWTPACTPLFSGVAKEPGGRVTH